ncbi:ankyrin repeat-containing domain protein [Aspergillus cavernicola]|uniref:Ankyrin repeat-containing domain protein n=1 Tax=Aspergillus cavernicola TaxID=176166 RepID=A0ABR4HXD0_9EURO
MATSSATIAASTPSTTTTRWQDAINRLDPDTRASLAGVATRKLDILHLVVKAADDKRKVCIAKQWKLKTPGGKIIILRDVLEKIAGWVNRFVAVGDTILQYDPSHAALAWAAFRFLLNVAVGDVQIWGGMLLNLETLAQLLYRCEVVENTHIKRSFSMTSHLQEAVVQLYVNIMGALATLVKYFKQGTGGRILWSAARSDHNLQDMTAVYAQEQEVLKWAALVDSELSQATNTEVVSIAHKVTTISTSLDAGLTRLMDTSLAMRHSLDGGKISKILLWLSTVPTVLHMKEIAARRLPGSGVWLLTHPDFHTWHTSSSSAIFLLHGVRGCGKSTVASLVVDHFQQPSAQPGATTVPCAHFLCDDSSAEPDRARADSILRTVVRQLAVDSAAGSIDPTVFSSYEKSLKAAEQVRVNMAKLSVKECLSLLLDLTATNPAYILIDAVDQLGQDERAILIDTLQMLVDQSGSIIKIFLTSCDNAHVEGLLNGATKLRVSSDCVHKDIREFATRQLQDANKRRRILNGAATATLLGKIKEQLINGAGEMFLWVTLQLDFLCRKKTEQDIMTALGTELTADLDQIYGRTLRHFHTLDSTATQAIVHIFSFLLYSKRPLHPAALAHTLALNPSLTNTGVMDLEDLCCSLVLLDMPQGVARFCHPSVHLCLRECAVGPSSSPFVGDESPVQEFYHYAAVYWLEHLRECEVAGLGYAGLQTQAGLFVARKDDGFISPAFLTWMDWIEQVCCDLPPYHRTRNTFETILNKSLSPVFITCVFGLRGLLLYVLEALPDVDINQRSNTGHTGIYLASSYGHQQVVSLLLDYKADPKLECGAFGTLTRVACFRGHLNVVQNLLPRIDELKSPEPFSRAYRAACLGGNAEIALFLANNCLAARSADQHSSMLQETIEAGFPNLVDWLTAPSTLKAWGLPNLTLNAQAGLVGAAIKQGQVAVLKSLLDKRPHLMQALPKDCIPIAATSGQLAMVEYLYSIGADPKEEGCFGSALRSASLMGCEPIVRMLIGSGVDVGRCGAEGDALQAASMNGHIRVMELLIQAGANVNKPGKPRGTCLQAAAWYGQKDAVELLLHHGADMYQKGHALDALHAAIESGHEEIAKLLLAKGYQPPKGVSLPAASRGDHGNFVFTKGNRAAHPGLIGIQQEQVEDDTESETGSVSKSSDGEESLSQASICDDGDDDDDDDKTCAPSDQARDPYTVLAENLELSAVAGDVNSLHYYLLRPESTGWGVISAIETAAVRGQVDTLSFLATKGISRRLMCDADYEMSQAMTPAAENGQSEALQILGNASSWEIRQSLLGWQGPFYAAVKSGNLLCVATLLRHHPDPDESFLEVFSSAIESSIRNKHRKISEFLLLWLLKLSAVENEVVTTANASEEEAVPTASAKMVSFLRMYLNPKVRGPGKDDRSARVFWALLVAVAKTGDARSLKLLLLKAETEGYMKGNEPSKVFEAAFLSACSHNVRDIELLPVSNVSGNCFTQQQISHGIHTAALAGKAKVVHYLAEKMLGGTGSEESRSKLYEAFLGASYRGNARVVQSMLDLSSFWNGIGEANKTTMLTRGLVAAVEHGHKKTAQLLLKNGADVQACVQEVPEPQSYSAEAAFLKCQPFGFGQFGRRPRYPQLSPRPTSPLQAVLRGFKAVAARETWERYNSSSDINQSCNLESLLGTLIDLGCDPDDQAGQSMYPIQNAARWANERAIQILLDAGAEPDRVRNVDDQRDSSHPILLAAARPYRFSYAIIAKLVEGGATLPRTGHGQVHPAVLGSWARAIGMRSSSTSRKPRGQWYESSALPLDVARQLFSGGMRALLTESFKQLPQQNVAQPEYLTLLTGASTAGDRLSVKLLLKHGVPVNHAGQKSLSDTPLGCAALYGHIHIIKDLLDAGADVDCHAFAYRPQDAMVKAIIGGHTAAVRLLVQRGAQRVRTRGRPFLLLAARTRNTEMVDCLLHLEFPIKGDSAALLAACDNGDVDIVLRLLLAGADPNKPGKAESTCTPLYQACRRGHLAIVQALLRHGADPNLRIKEGLGMPLVVTASKGHLEVVRALLKHGAKPDRTAVVLSRSAARRPAWYPGEEWEPADDTAGTHWPITPTALNEACTNGHLEVVEELLSHGACVIDGIASTCSGSWSSAKANILELLLETVSGRGDFEKIWKSAVSDESLTHRGHLIELLLDYVSPSTEILVLAVSSGSISAVDRCLTRGIDPNNPNQLGHLPLASAARSLHKEVVRRLVLEGASVDELDEQGQTPLLGTLEGFRTSLAASLQTTARSHHSSDLEDIVHCLVKGGARAAGEVLEVACSLGHAGVVAILLAHREPSDAWQTGLQNCLFAALDADNPDVVCLLLKNGTDPHQARSLQPSDPRAQFLLPQTQAMIEQTPVEAACGKQNDCLVRAFLASVPDLRIPPRVLTTAARSWLHQTGSRPAHCSDLAIILEHDASLIVPDSVLEILTEDYEGHLLKLVLPRSRCSDRSRFQPRPLSPRAPPTLSQIPRALVERRYTGAGFATAR